jgi:hypothetical protein
MVAVEGTPLTLEEITAWLQGLSKFKGTIVLLVRHLLEEGDEGMHAHMRTEAASVDGVALHNRVDLRPHSSS